jgi:DNA invertase Pin-like site-specific DNA recombinase
MSARFVAYYRVSTERLGKSGLGLEAQQSAVAGFLAGAEPVASFTEIESGKRNERPQLTMALEACRKLKAQLVIAKLDRLSRNLAFIATMMESGVEFVAVDNPHANRLTVHILAAVAQHEREMISERTKAALAAAKRRGVRLGNPALGGVAAKGTEATKLAAKQFTTNVLPVIREIQATGVASFAGIAAKLRERRIATARGGQWTHVQVGTILMECRLTRSPGR